MRRAAGLDDPPRKGSPGHRQAALLLAGAPLLLAAVALLSASGSALAYHSNPTCLSGSYTQTWNAQVNIISPQPAIVDECILVQANVTVQAGGELRFRDSQLVFDNNVGNFTIHVNQSGLLEFRDDDGNTATNDRSWLGVLNRTVTWTGFFLTNDPGARLYFNDTDIFGGGLPGAGLFSANAFFVDGPGDFSWNRITHETASSGLVLANYTRGLTIPSYAVTQNAISPFRYGLVLERCANVNVTAYSNPIPGGSTAVFVNEGQSITLRNSTAKTADFGFRFLLTDGVIVEDTSSQQHLDTGFIFDRVDGATLNRLSAVPAQVAHFGVRLISSTSVEMGNVTLGKHDVADLDLSGTTRWVNGTHIVSTTTRAGSGIRIFGLGGADDAADITLRNVNVSLKGPSGGYAVWLRNANRVLFDTYNISGAAGMGVGLETSSSVRFVNGIVTSNAQGVGFSNSGNMSFAYSDLIGNAGGGLTIGGGSFTLDHVVMRSPAGWSIRSAASTLLTGISEIRDSTIEGVLSTAVDLALGSGSNAQLRVVDDHFVRQQNSPQFYLALNLTGFLSVLVDNTVFDSYGIQVVRAGDVEVRDSTLDVTLLPTTTTLLRFQEVGTLLLEGNQFGDDPIAGKIGQVVNVTRLFGSATIAGMALPRADYGVFVQGEGGTFSPSLNLTDVSMTALVEGVKGWLLLDATVEHLTTYASARAVVLDLRSTATGAQYTVANSTLEARDVGISSTSDTQGVLRVVNVTFDRSNSTPTVGLAVITAHDVFVEGLAVDGLPTGMDIRSARWLWLADMEFRDNANWGLRMTADPSEPTDINWTVDRPTVVSNSHLMIRGQVWVTSTDFTVTQGSRIDIFATGGAPSPSRFHFEGSSRLAVNGNSTIAGWEELVSSGRVNAYYTMELSPQASIALDHATFDRMGLAGSVPAVQKGFLVQSQDTTVDSVRFINGSAALRAVGVNLTVIGSEFAVRTRVGFSVDVEGGMLTVRGGSILRQGDGARVQDGVADVSNTSFDSVGAALTADRSSGTLVDSSVVTSTNAIQASNGSNVEACRLFLYSDPHLFVADGSSTVRFCDSTSIRPTTEGDSLGGSLVEFENVFVERTANGAMAYSVLTPGSTFRAYWWVTVRVTSCPSSTGLPIDGADVEIYDKAGSVVFVGKTGADGRTAPQRLLYFESQDNVPTEHAPFTFTASKGILSTTITHPANQTADIVACLDDQPPEMFLFLPPGCPLLCVLPDTQNGTISLRGSTRDNISGLAQGYPCISINNDTCTPISPSFDLQRPLVEGANEIIIRSRDIFGNEANITIYVTRDTTPPEFVSCDPPASYKASAGEVDLVCQMAGDPQDPPTISGVRATEASIDASQVLRAHITLGPGVNTFQVTVADALGNTNSSSFSWLLDNTAPVPTLLSGYNETVTRLFGVRLRATVPTDTANVTWDGEDVPFPSNSLNVEWTNLTEGYNERTLRVTDDVGNSWQATVWIIVDQTTNCTLAGPTDGEHKLTDTVAVGGTCDPDVTVSISGLVGALTPDADGRWSGDVQLHSGANLIEVHGVDSNGVDWFDQVTVYYDAKAPEPIPFAFILLIVLAAGVFAAAIILMRRPRRPPPEEPPRPLTGSHKAPPRARPPPLRLPEQPEDRPSRAPPPPPLPPPRYPPRQPPRP